MEKLTAVTNKVKCEFCKIAKNDFLNYGPKYKLGNFTAHYYCVLLSNRLIQNGKDNEGLLGFLLPDIEEELKRTANILCVYCKRGNANILCAASKCKKTFHLPCGLKKGSSHQFMKQFKSFCHIHHLVQNVPLNIFKEACRSETICCICQERVHVKSKKNIMWAPCCLKAWYHRSCLQKLAHSAGYFFRCAFCNDVKKFNEYMQQYGIFIPKQDASWEMVPNAFEELLFRYNKCDAVKCKCPDGRQSNTENTIWEIILCESCGSQGIHVACGGLKFIDPEWECPGCQEVSKNMNSSEKKISCSNKLDEDPLQLLKLTEVLQKKRRRGSEDYENSVLDKRKKSKINLEEKEVEIDVEAVEEEAKEGKTYKGEITEPKDVFNMETESEKISRHIDPQEILSWLKPGPLSHKLAVIQRVLGDNLVPSKEKLISHSNLSELSDSDDETIQVIQEIKTTTEGCTNPSFRCRANERKVNEQKSEDVIITLKESKNFDFVAVLSIKSSPERGNISSLIMQCGKEVRPCSDQINHSSLTARTFTPIKVKEKEKESGEPTHDDEVIILTD